MRRAQLLHSPAWILAAALAAGSPVAGAAEATPLATLVVQPESGANERLFDGLVEAVRQATLTAQTSGRIAEVLHDADDRVRSGELLLRLAGVEQRSGLRQAEESLREAEARAADAESEFQRISQVWEKRLVARSALDRATADHDAAVARLKAAQAGVATARETFGYTELRAPYASVVTRRYVESGESVSPGQPLVQVAALEAMRVALEVPAATADAVRRLQQAAVVVGDRRIGASRITVFPAASPQSSTVRVRLDLPQDTPGLYPGMFVKAGFGIGASTRLVIPLAAVVERSEITAVYVVGPAGEIGFRQVRLGRRFGDQVEVLAGLVAGERIAADPVAAARRLKSR